MADLTMDQAAVLVVTAAEGKARDAKDLLHGWGVDADTEALRRRLAGLVVEHAGGELAAAIGRLVRVWVVAEAREGGWEIRLVVRPWRDGGPQLVSVMPVGQVLAPGDLDEMLVELEREWAAEGMGDGRPVRVEVVR